LPIWRQSGSPQKTRGILAAAKSWSVFRFAVLVKMSSSADPTMSLAVTIFVDREEQDEAYFVAPAMRGLLAEDLKPVLLQLTINRKGVVFIWPLTLPSEDNPLGRSWHESARKAAEIAKTDWIRIGADKGLGGYRVRKAEGHLSDPQWPDKTFNELLKIAFADRIILSEDRPGSAPAEGARLSLANLPFREIWGCDFEYQAPPGEKPRPVCMCAREFRTGQELRLWREDLIRLRHAPFNTGSDSVVVTYAAAAEASAFLSWAGRCRSICSICLPSIVSKPMVSNSLAAIVS
jgi:hypothetical protein